MNLRTDTLDQRLQGESFLRVWPVLGVIALQLFLFFAHWFLFHTFTSFLPIPTSAQHPLGITLCVLATTFVAAALLQFRFSNFAVELLYKVAAIWLGVLNFLFWAACLCWMVELGLWLGNADTLAHRESTAGFLFSLALLICLYGFANARVLRERRVTVLLDKLPPSWRGRSALLITDMHLGNVNGAGFARRVAGIARRLKPDVIFIAGDLFDGSRLDADKAVAPLATLTPPFGVFFSGGNHEEFGDVAEYEAAIQRSGIRILHNERVELDGLQVIGISYAESIQPLRMRTFLDHLNLHQGQASVLLNHVPNRLPITEEAGVSLQVSGHTHGGQIFPFTALTRRMFREFTYGLQRFGNLQVLTSSGVGTWGPPMRVGTEPEVVLITFA